MIWFRIGIRALVNAALNLRAPLTMVSVSWSVKPTGKILLGRLLENILNKIIVNTRKLDDLVLDRDYWRSLVDAALSLRFPQAM